MNFTEETQRATKGGSVGKTAAPATTKTHTLAPHMNDLIAIDLETSGTIPGVHTPLSIAAVTATGASFHRLIKPVKGLEIDPEAVKVNGYTPEAWAIGGAVDLATAASDFRDFVTTTKRGNGAWIPLAHNAGFDKGFTEWIERHVGFEFGLSYRWECSMAVLAFLMRRGVVQHGKCNLDRLCELAGVTRKTPHCALADAEACLAGYRWAVTKAGEWGDTLRQLYADSLKQRNAMEAALKALLVPYVVEDYYPECATPGYREAVEKAAALAGIDLASVVAAQRKEAASHG